MIYHPIHFLFFFEVLAFAKFANNPLRSVSWGWAIAIFLCSFVAIWELTTDRHLSMAQQEGNEMKNVGDAIVQHMTASVTFHNPNSYVTRLCYAFPWIVYLMLTNEKGIIKKAVLLFTILTTLVVILFNMSRGGLLSFGVMGLVFFFLSPKSIGKTFISVIICVVFGYIIVNYGQDALSIMEARASGGGLTHDDARLGIWKTSLNILADYLFVGAGVGSITAALQGGNTNIVASPHSLFFEILVQYGVVFTFAVVCFLVKLYIGALKVKERNRKTVLLMSLFAMPAYTIIDSVYLLGVDFFALIGTIYIFIHIDSIQKDIICKKSKLV